MGLSSSHTERGPFSKTEESARPGGGGKGRRVWAVSPKNHGDKNQWPEDEHVRSGLRGCWVAGKGGHSCRDRSCPRVLTSGCSPWRLRGCGQDGRGPGLIRGRKGAGEPLLACPSGAWRSPWPLVHTWLLYSSSQLPTKRMERDRTKKSQCRVPMARSF